MSWRDYLKPRVSVMLALGFSSGLPFLLTGATLGYWLRDEGTTLTLIGFISWVGFAYSLKVFWAPLVDRVDAPFLGRLGRRRSWIVLAQVIVALALIGMAVVTPKGGLTTLGAFALLTAIASATQDIVIDAWRIESAATKDELGLLSAAYQLGYRAALITAESLILFIAGHFSWPVSYVVMAALMGVGFVATMRAPEPTRALAATAANVAAPFPRGPAFFDAFIGPFTVFFKTHGWVALLMLGMISLYRLPEFVLGPMATPLYKDLGFSKDAVATMRGSIGLASTFLGVATGGFFSQRFGYMKSLIAGGLFQTVGVAGFAILARSGGDLRVFGAVIAGENFGNAFAGVALITYMSSLTSFGYTATQYALLSSTYTYLGKFLKGFSGVIVDHLALSRSLFDAYAIFFVGAGAIGLPAVILCVVLMRVQAKRHTMTHA